MAKKKSPIEKMYKQSSNQEGPVRRSSVQYGTPEYEKAYKEGRVATAFDPTTSTYDLMDLPEFTVTNKKTKKYNQSNSKNLIKSPIEKLFMLNPKNWGVADYSKSNNFNSAYASAKKAGEKEFIYNGKRFSTKSDMSPEQEMKVYGITDDQRITGVKKKLNPIRQALSNLNTTDGYDTPISKIIDVAKGKVEGRDFSNEPESLEAKEQDALRLYMGLPQKSNTFFPSRYKEGAFEINEYNELLPELLPSDDFIKHYGKPLKRREHPPYRLNEEDIKAKLGERHVYTGVIKPFDDYVMGRHTVKKGKDERGEYLEYIDKFDFDTYKYPLNVPLSKINKNINDKNINIPLGSIGDALNKPFNIYGRKYYKDYGDGLKRAMYYTDDELYELDTNKKNFDTLALQRELSNRNYQLPKSTKQDGSFDGVWGNETKKALEDWKKTKYKK